MINCFMKTPDRAIAPIQPLASGLNLFTFQGVVMTHGDFVLTTLDSCLVQVSAEGKVKTLADVSKYGIPAGIAAEQGSYIVAVSAEESGDLLMRITSAGQPTVLADLSDVCGGFGAPFGVAVVKDGYLVAIATDVNDSVGRLIKVDRKGRITTVADLTGYGLPFGVAVDGDTIVVAQETGHLLNISSTGDVSPLVNLVKLGFGIPLGVTLGNQKVIATTNSGLVVQVGTDGVPVVLADITKAQFGIPAGIALRDRQLVVTTNSGYLLQINSDQSLQ
jgi:hypothetical protein